VTTADISGLPTTTSQFGIRPSREPYRIVNEPRGPRYRGLLREGARVSDRFLFVDISEPFYREHDTSFGPAAKRLVEELAPHLISLTSDRSWPGTRLGEVHGVKSYARIYRYRLDAESLEMLQRATDHLFSWQPPLPLDLCLLRPDGEAWLTTIASEDTAYLRLAPEEVAPLMDRTGMDLQRYLRH